MSTAFSQFSFLAIGFSMFMSYAQAADLPAQCLKSFKVQDKSFTTGKATMSCKLTEIRRGELFEKINAMSETGEIDGNAVAKELASAEARLEKEEKNKNWVGLSAAISGNFLATIGLSSCLPGNAAGCAVAAVGKVLSIVGMIDSGKSEADKIKFTADLRKDIAAIRKAIENKKSPAKALRDRMIAEFTQMCDDVQKQCLS